MTRKNFWNRWKSQGGGATDEPDDLLRPTYKRKRIKGRL